LKDAPQLHERLFSFILSPSLLTTQLPGATQ